MKKQPKDEPYDYETPKASVYDARNSLLFDHKPVTEEMDPAYQSTMLVNKTSGDHPSEYELIKGDDGDVNVEENPTYAETQFI